MDLSVVVVTYHSKDYVGGCLDALAEATKGLEAEVVVVDNASSDGTAETVRSLAPWARVVARDVNDGFAGGCHAGADVATGRHLLFLNPDAIVSADTLTTLLEYAGRHPEAGIVGGRQVTESGGSDPRSWWNRPDLWSAICFAVGLSTVFPGNRLFDREPPRAWSGDPEEEFPVPVVSGAMMLVERRLWDRLGGFDRAFFMYGEDADLCLRAAKAGYRPRVTAAAVYLHPGGMSSSSARKLLLLFTGKVSVVRRHFPPGLRRIGAGLLLFGVWLRATMGRWVGGLDAERRGRRSVGGQEWSQLWADRAKWRAGWKGSQ
ncbi:glycosyltransferase family 2 protein [Streptosporangium carneum]|uniref:Glycosyltransferase 2-like domain-containing protein n=1 Tax=Streptosporangium carneum TaxID=47481 RepID=A0A9W6IAB4_9ACTN|nr:glycosyltransferase family 2 protein [Streptosporangium carneum]GLK14346.1 hypothetical protein GCM10017600_77580 [Streptosporangium carneum]